MRKGFLVLLLLGLLVALAACSQPTVPANQTESLARMVTLDSGDTLQAVERRYGGEVVVWRPEASFAILKTSAGRGLAPVGISAEPNENVVSVPELTHVKPGLGTQGWTAWSGGWTAWSGGWTAWSGAWTAWSGGEAGSLEPLENHDVWEQIDLFRAHDLADHLGAGVTVAVIDTGVDTAHPVFQGHLTPADTWKDFVDHDSLPQEVAGPDDAPSSYGHGTAVAGIIRQVAPQAEILPIRALRPDGSGDLTAVVSAIDWATRQDVDIINLSLGAKRHSPILQFMIDRATSQGIYVVSSSGNTGDQHLTYPAARSGKSDHAGLYSLGVGSADSDDQIAAYSTYGHKLEVLAPGSEITTSAPDDRLAHWSGTSMAAAVTSGALALAIGEHPAAAGLTEALAMSADSIEAANAKRYRGKLGHGRIDVTAFLESLGD